MINQQLKKKILKERADLLKLAFAKVDEAGEIMEGLEFVLAYENYVIDSDYIVEVVPIKELTPLPCTPDFILGIINVRGKILSVIDIKRFFNLPEKGITNLNRVIILQHNGIELGILADEIVGSRQVFHNQLQSKTALVTNAQNDFIIGITKDRAIVVDIKEFLQNEKIIINETV